MKAGNVDFLVQGYAQLELVSNNIKSARLAEAWLPRPAAWSIQKGQGTRKEAHL